MLLEVVVIALSSMLLALFASQFAAEALSTHLLQNDLISMENPVDERFSLFPPELTWFYGGQMTADEFIAQYDVSLTREAVVLFFGVGGLTVLLATVIPVVYIVRLQPKKVLL